jgi:hypothetical protein
VSISLFSFLWFNQMTNLATFLCFSIPQDSNWHDTLFLHFSYSFALEILCSKGGQCFATYVIAFYSCSQFLTCSLPIPIYIIIYTLYEANLEELYLLFSFIVPYHTT